MLAIITPNISAIAETFIRQHISLIAPQKTVVVYFKGDADFLKGVISYKVINNSHGKLTSIKNYILKGYSGAVTGASEKLLEKFLIENNVNCVLAEFGQTGCYIFSLCKKLRIPLYVFFHGHDAGVAGKKLKNRISYWRMARYATKIFTATNTFSQKVILAGVPKSKIQVIPYGLFTNQFFSAEQKDANLIVAVGRMVEKKAPHLAIKAFARVLNQVPNARLEMVGDGDLLDLAKKTAMDLKIDKHIVFHGAKEPFFVKDLVAKASVFVQHSVTAPNGDTESLGVSLLEAMASETPVVTTKHNGFVETIADGETGFLVEERDIDAMASKIILLLQDDNLRIKMGKKGRERVIKFYNADKQAQLLREVIKL